MAKKPHQDPSERRNPLVYDEPDHRPLADRPEHPMPDTATLKLNITEPLAQANEVRCNLWVVGRTGYEMHPSDSQTERIRGDLPGAKVTTEHQDSTPVVTSGGHVLPTPDFKPLFDILGTQSFRREELKERSSKVSVATLDDVPTSTCIEIRKGESEVAVGESAVLGVESMPDVPDSPPQTPNRLMAQPTKSPRQHEIGQVFQRMTDG